MTKENRWVPVRRGAVYCSPRCGGKCKHADFVKAGRDAARLAARLGPRWRPVVWENLGWHWIVAFGSSEHHHGLFEVHKYDARNWSAWYNGFPQTIEHSISSEGALALLKSKLRSYISQIQHDIHIGELGS